MGAVQGLPDTLHRLDARRRRRLLSLDGKGRRLHQEQDAEKRRQQGPEKVPTGSATGPATQPGGPSTPAPVPPPPYVPGTSFRVDLLQQRSDKVTALGRGPEPRAFGRPCAPGTSFA